VDDVRDMILKKYANSLGRTFDAPDMTLRIVTRADQGQQSQRIERVLGPEEEICRTLDSYYPGGQTVDEALIIDVPLPQKRPTPKPSPRAYAPGCYHGYSAVDEFRPLENGTDYFPPMPAIIPASIPQTAGSHDSRGSQHGHHGSITSIPAGLEPHQRSIAVLNTGQIPPLPSPGGSRRHREHRPKYTRQHTSSPTVLSHPSQHMPNAGAVAVNPPPNLNHPLAHRGSNRPRVDSSASEAHGPNGLAAPPPLPTPPAPDAPPGARNKDGTASTPPTPNQGAAPVPGLRNARPRKARKPTPEKLGGSRPRHQRDDSGQPNGRGHSANNSISITSVLDGTVPPINVLIVEDNIINLRILEGLMKRLKVRWQTALNGQIAVDKWKTGGFHLVLMDIQMPVMNGLQATKEIRRLERVNGIGVFSEPESTTSSPTADKRGGKDVGKSVSGGGLADGEGPSETNGRAAHDKEDDKLDVAGGLFKSPVIIVALTASSLQSDRHEALAAGCNDFLTKPVNFVWLERKVKEWGCMQALIDFDGWRKWRGTSS
jgi:osomolarity two-component system, response regulator SSK1